MDFEDVVLVACAFLMGWATAFAILDATWNAWRRQRILAEYADRGVPVTGRVLSQKRKLHCINLVPARKSHELSYSYHVASAPTSTSVEDVVKKNYYLVTGPCSGQEEFTGPRGQININLLLLPGYPESAFPRQWITRRQTYFGISICHVLLLVISMLMWAFLLVMSQQKDPQKDTPLMMCLVILALLLLAMPLANKVFAKWKKERLGPPADSTLSEDHDHAMEMIDLI